MRFSKLATRALGLGILAMAGSAQAVTVNVFSQNFDTDPVNYDATFGFGSANDRYFNLSNAVNPSNLAPIILNPQIQGATGNYLAVQNINEAPFTYTSTNPAVVTFNPINVTGLNSLNLSFSAAGNPGAEANVNYIRGLTDQDNDGTYETTLFFFNGTADNTPYTDAFLGALSSTFQTKSIALGSPSNNGPLKLRLEIFNDTDGFGEAVGIDNIVVTGEAVPEPASLGLLGVAALGLLRRRRA